MDWLADYLADISARAALQAERKTRQTDEIEAAQRDADQEAKQAMARTQLEASRAA